MAADQPPYSALFRPDAHGQEPFDEDRAFGLADVPGITGRVRYVFDADTILAVNVALATGRPLLLRGHPGTGKTSLAQSVANGLDWRFYELTITSRTSARDLLWSLDSVRRLADAQAAGNQRGDNEMAYVTPGPLWWAFDPDSAKWRGVPKRLRTAAQGRGLSPLVDPSGRSSKRAVVLLDEIDKADPDVPNDLLGPLGSLRFSYDSKITVEATAPPLIVITTNEERDLPRAFLRRCVVHTLQHPDPGRLREIAQAHAGEKFDSDLFAQVLDSYTLIRSRRINENQPPPSVSELLDTLAACRALATDTAATTWSAIARNLLDKATGIPADVP